MKTNFKPLGLAAAVAAVTAGYAGVANAQTVTSQALGDLAVIPYYTVQEEWGTGMHIINTSFRTQVVKLRFRRGSDSLDALDLNLIMSPEDEWVGFLSDEDGTIRLTTQDTTCTAPLPVNGGFSMPPIYREGADEGYIEVISMGSPVDVIPAQAGIQEYEILTGSGVSGTIPFGSLAYNAEHVDGVPRNCAFAKDNFLDYWFGTTFGGAVSSTANGVAYADQTFGFYTNPSTGDTDYGETNFEDAGNALKVSWFIRDAATGIEFGNDAYHVFDFENQPMLTNQELGWNSGNLRGFDFPDLNGGSPQLNGNWIGGTPAPRYDALRNAFGVSSVINDWSDNPGLSVGTDWVVTIPGQYIMLDLPEYIESLKDAEDGPDDDDFECDIQVSGTDGCDKRDIPVRAAFTIWDREEGLLTAPGDRDVVVSPSIPGAVPTTQLETEVNVIHWSAREVMDSDYEISVDTSLLAQVSGWARLIVSSKSTVTGTPTQDICLWNTEGYNPQAADPNDLMVCTTPVTGSVPMVGFVAWERSFPDNPDGNYGRAVQHSFES